MSVGVTLVRETCILDLCKGLNRGEFSWGNTVIDPTSVELRELTHSDDVDVLDVSFPPRVNNTLEWRIQSGFAGEVQVEIRYFTSGISWSADYLAEAARNEKLMDLAGNVRVSNNSGEDYDNAQIRLVVGVVRLVENIVTLARGPHPASAPTSVLLAKDDKMEREAFVAFNGAVALADVAAKEKQVVKENLTEYFLYTVDGRDRIPTGWAKRLPSFKAGEVPITSFYKYEREQWGDHVLRYYRFTNSTPSKLGSEPLPDGAVKAFRFVTDDKLYGFVGATAVKYIPVNEQVDLELGEDLEVLVKPT